MSASSFVIRNDSSTRIFVQVEPEAHRIALDCEDKVAVRDVYQRAPATLAVTTDGDGHVIVSVWPGDGEVTATKDGVDVLELPLAAEPERATRR